MDDIGAVMNAVDSGRAALLSWAECALAVMLFAATSPQRVASLVLVNAYARFVRSEDTPWGMPTIVFLPALRTLKRRGALEWSPRSWRRAWCKAKRAARAEDEPNACRRPPIASPSGEPPWRAT